MVKRFTSPQKITMGGAASMFKKTSGQETTVSVVAPVVAEDAVPAVSVPEVKKFSGK